MLTTAIVILIALTILFIYGCKVLYVPTYKGEKSDHFDGKRFYNPNGNEMGSFRKLMNYQLKNKRAKWHSITTTPTKFTPDKSVNSGIKFKQINHATVLIQHEGLNILTDPVYSKRASPFSITGPKRHRSASIHYDSLPPIDIVVISHDHYDHLDVKTLRRLSKDHQPSIYVGLGLKGFLEKFDIQNVVEMDWNETKIHEGITIDFLRCKHWSNRFVTPYKTLWGSWMFRSESKQIYFAGDTGYDGHFAEIKAKYGEIDLALIPIGAYVPRFFMKHVHMDPQDAMKVHELLNPKQSLAIHWGTFQLTGEGMYDPIDELQELIEKKGQENFLYDRNHDQYYAQL